MQTSRMPSKSPPAPRPPARSPAPPSVSPVAACAVLSSLTVLFLGAGTLSAQETDSGEEPAALSGLVVRAESARPVEGARVDVVERDRSTLTDSAGRFTIFGLEADTVTLRVSYLGGATTDRTVVLRSGRTARVRIEVEPEAVAIEGVDVVAVRSARKPLELFALRYEQGGGRVVTREEVEAHDGLLSNLISRHNPYGPGTKMRRLKSVHYHRLKSGGSLTVGGQPGFGADPHCDPQLFVNGRRADWVAGSAVMFGQDDLDTFRSEEISAIEIYPPIAVPHSLRTRKSRQCGAIVLWERDYITGEGP